MPIHLVSIETDADRALQPIVRQGSQSADRETPVPALTPAPSSQTAAAPSSGSRAPAAAAAADAPDRHVSLPDTEVAAYRQLLEAHLAQYRIYPPGARASHSEGVVVLHFVTDRDGRVSDAWVESSSGVSALDQEALLAVARAQPLPRFPSDWPAKIDFSLPLVFKLS